MGWKGNVEEGLVREKLQEEGECGGGVVFFGEWGWWSCLLGCFVAFWRCLMVLFGL
jgi:hypothetical protein